MAGKTVNILISAEELANLKDNAYRLCFAKKVNNTFNVVWQSYRQYLRNNSFLWTPVYQLFGSNIFQGKLIVKTSTDPVNINLGQQATLNKYGVLGPASTGGPPTAITMINDYDPIHPGLNQLSTGIDGSQVSTPIYVAEKQIVKGIDELTPKQEVMVWFEQNIETSTMFSDAKSHSVSIDLTNSNEQTRFYSDGGWSTPSAEDLAAALNPILLIIVYVTGAITAYQLASKITSKLTGVYSNITVDVTTGAENKVTVIYSERPGLASAEQSFLAMLLTTPVPDQLLKFTVESLAQCSVGFTKLDAIT